MPDNKDLMLPPPAPSSSIAIPVENGRPGPTWDAAPPEDFALPISHYIWLLNRHRWKILAFVVITVAATVVVSSRTTPIYESTATVDIDRQMPTGIIGQEVTRFIQIHRIHAMLNRIG